MTEILEGIEQEGGRIVRRAASAGVPLRMIGGVAVHAHAAGGLPPAFSRPYRDIDLVTLRGRSGDVQRFMQELGYEPNVSFNTLNGADRMVFYDRAHGRQLDVFVGAFRMCHEIPIRPERFEKDRVTLPLAELLLTKLQIVSLNEKDLRDIYGLVHEHEVREDDDDAINAEVVAAALAADWGLWRTSRMTLERSRAHLAEMELPQGAEDLIEARLAALWERVEARPKGVRWRGRARIGDRVRWYEEPDEITHQQL
jgi:hypothetical protein